MRDRTVPTGPRIATRRELLTVIAAAILAITIGLMLLDERPAAAPSPTPSTWYSGPGDEVVVTP